MSKKIKPFAKPGWTGCNNYVWDYMMPDLSPSAWKILSIAIRLTLGWEDKSSPTGRREQETIPYSLFSELGGKGVQSHATISKALNELLEKEYLVRVPSQDHSQSYAYKLNVDLEIEIEEQTTSKSEEVGAKTSSENEEVENAAPGSTTSKSEEVRAKTSSKNEEVEPETSSENEEVHNITNALSKPRSGRKKKAAVAASASPTNPEQTQKNPENAPPSGHGPDPPSQHQPKHPPGSVDPLTFGLERETECKQARMRARGIDNPEEVADPLAGWSVNDDDVREVLLEFTELSGLRPATRKKRQGWELGARECLDVFGGDLSRTLAAMRTFFRIRADDADARFGFDVYSPHSIVNALAVIRDNGHCNSSKPKGAKDVTGQTASLFTF